MQRTRQPLHVGQGAPLRIRKQLHASFATKAILCFFSRPADLCAGFLGASMQFHVLILRRCSFTWPWTSLGGDRCRRCRMRKWVQI